jgi:hypothetical protein
MPEKSEESKVRDPFQAWRAWRDAGMEAWSKVMLEVVRNEEFARTSGTLLNTWLTASAPAREVLQSLMAAALEQCQMPPRAEVIRLAERLTKIEMRLDDLDAKLDGAIRRRPRNRREKVREVREK